MYVQRLKFSPETGAQEQVRTILEERLEAIGKTGKTGNIRGQVAFGDDGPTLEMNVVHERLADFQAFREANRGNPISDQLKDLIHRPPNTSLMEIIGALGPSDRLEAPFFVQRAIAIPIVGHNGELQPLLQEHSEKQGEQGVRTVFGQTIYGRKPRGFIIATQVENLNALEEYLNALKTDESFRQLMRNVRDVAITVEYELWEVFATAA
jgi:hypothetical protein